MSSAATASPAPPTRYKRKRYEAAPYVRGQFDALLPIKEHSAPDELRGVTFEISATGLSLVATELCKDGRTPRRIVNAFPYYLDITLPDGRSASIEVRMYDAPEPEPLTIVRKSRPRKTQQPKFAPASLSEFGDDDEGYGAYE